MCKKLYCRVGDKCYSNSEPPADGTSCGISKHCINHACLRIGKELAHYHIDGGWSEWKKASKCNRNCGGGIEIFTRECNNPIPQKKGKYCVGDDIEYRTCNVHSCNDVGNSSSSHSPQASFREQQCEKFNQFNNKWIAYIERDEVCALYCVDESGFKKKFAEMVENGTPCTAGANDMCINGKCEVSWICLILINSWPSQLKSNKSQLNEKCQTNHI
jgi:hypothetical protein